MNVYAWRSTPIEVSELPALVYRDRTESKAEGCGIFENSLSIEIEIYGTTPDQIRECIAELEKAINADKTWGGFALHTKLETSEMMVAQKENIFTATNIVMTVFYLTVIGDPYTKGY